MAISHAQRVHRSGHTPGYRGDDREGGVKEDRYGVDSQCGEDKEGPLTHTGLGLTREEGRWQVTSVVGYVLCGTNLCLLEVDKDEVGRLVASSSHTLQTRTTERRKLKATPTASSSWLMCLTKVDSKLFNV